jgi:hypothetical protein
MGDAHIQFLFLLSLISEMSRKALLLLIYFTGNIQCQFECWLCNGVKQDGINAIMTRTDERE